MHHACPITVVMCAAAAAMLPGTVPSAAAPRLTAQAQGDTTVLVGHPKAWWPRRIAFLCSRPAGYINGEFINVDGGFHRSAW